ncbi:MAG: LPS export ABC transporter periplasmic protein LptC [Xanthomonadales bacterium]
MISRRTRRGLILLALLAVLTWLLARPVSEPAAEPLAGLDTRLNYALRDFSGRLLNDEGLTSLELSAPLLRNDSETGIGTVEEPNIRIQQDDEEWYISAESAVIAADREVINLTGAVNVRRRNDATGEQIEIRTRELVLNVTPRTASTRADVRIVQAGDWLSATGMNLDMINDRYELLDAVRGHYETP